MGLIPGIGAGAGFQVVLKRGDALQERFAAQKTVDREVAHFREVAARVTSADELLKDHRALKFVLASFQMEGEIGKRAIVKKLMTEDPAGDTSLANKFADPRYRELAQAVSGWNPPKLRDASTVEQIVKGYVTNSFEKSAGEDNPGLREVLYFRRKAGGVTSINGLMGDKVLTYVARVALGLPESFGLLDFEQQRRVLEQRLDLGQFATADGIDRFSRRFLALNELNGSGGSQSADPRLALFGGDGSGGSGIMGVLGQALNLRV